MVKRARPWLLAILMVCLTSSLFAASEVLLTTGQVDYYKISTYEFVVEGKTSKYVLRNAIIPSGGDPLFKDEEALVKALDRKKQLLVNKRVFISVDYTYELESYSKGIAEYVVTFYIEDASTFIALPYPKFDNDKTGLLLGVKAKDTNFFGTFGEFLFTGYVAQNAGGITGWENRKDFIELSLSDLRLGAIVLNFAVDYTHVKSSHNNGSFGFDVGLSGIRMMGVNLGFSFWGDYKVPDELSALAPKTVGGSMSYGPFKQNGALYTLYTKVELRDSMKTLYSYTQMSQNDLRLFKQPITFNMGAETYNTVGKTTMDTVNISSTVGTSFRLPFGFSWGTSVKGLVEYEASLNPVRASLTYTNALNYSSLNYTGNFRKGWLFNVSHTYKQYPQEEYEGQTHWFIEGSTTIFPFIAGRFNPNVRLSGFYSPDQPYLFLPSSDKNVMDDYLRGFLSSSPFHGIAEGSTYWAGIMNLNFTMEFINFGFARSYINPFIDIGVFANSSEESGMTILASAGIEGWGILKRFPSYPIRGSLGLNLADVRSFLLDEIEARDIEWELFIGFDLFF